MYPVGSSDKHCCFHDAGLNFELCKYILKPNLNKLLVIIVTEFMLNIRFFNDNDVLDKKLELTK